MRNYIGKEGVLKSGTDQLLLYHEPLRCAKGVVRDQSPRRLIDSPREPTIDSARLNRGSLTVCSGCPSYRNPCRKLPIRLLKSESRLRRSSTFRIE